VYFEVIHCLIQDVPFAEEEEEEEEEKVCSNPGCKEKLERLKSENSRLNMCMDLRGVTRRYRRLETRSFSKASGRITKTTRKLLSSQEAVGDPVAATEASTLLSSSGNLEPSISQQPPGFQEPESPDHGLTLSEYTCIILT